jgi:hypothetical protein
MRFTKLYEDVKASELFKPASPEEVDRINILQATFLAMKRAIDSCGKVPDFLYIDGYTNPPRNTFRWNSVPNATGYILYWRGDTEWRNGSFDVGSDRSITISWGRVDEAAFTGDETETAYVRVRAYNNGGYSPFSDEVNGR